MILYIDKNDIYSHCFKIIMAEKNIEASIIHAQKNNLPEELLKVNPQGTLPTLADRDNLVITIPHIIVEYLDERFPHPPLLPVYPIARAKYRLMTTRIEREWFALAKLIQQGEEPNASKARQLLTESLISFAPVFSNLPYFLSEDFSLMDCYVAPVLWLLPQLGIELPSSIKAIEAYKLRIFERPSFKTSIIPAPTEEDEFA